MGVLSPAQSSPYQAGPPGANVHFYPSHPFILSSLTLLLLTPFTMLLPGPTMLSDADSIESRPPLGHPSATVATGVYRRTQSVDATASSSPQSAAISVFACESIIFFHRNPLTPIFSATPSARAIKFCSSVACLLDPLSWHRFHSFTHDF